MVKVNFKLTDTPQIQVEIAEPESLATILALCEQQLGIPVGPVIAIHSGKVCAEKDLIGVDEVLDIFPALAGG